MKNLNFLIVGLLLLYFSDISNNKVVAQEGSTTEKTLSIASTPDLYNLTNNWASEFGKLNPDVKVKVVKFTETNSSNILNTGANLYIVSNETYTNINNKDLWKMQIGKDALVPIMNSKNPFLHEIQKQNISPEILAQILVNPDNRKWYGFLKTGKSEAINYYMVNNQVDKSMISKFLSTKRTISGIGIDNYEKMISAIQNDPYSIGFCKLSNLIKSQIANNITIMPFDRNGNGKIDDFENVYSDLQTFMEKAWVGKYPKELTGNIYTIASQTPSNEAEVAFLKWISVDGQQFLNQMGYSALVYNEKHSNLKALGVHNEYIASSEDASLFTFSQYLFASLMLLFFVVGMMVTISSRKNTVSDIAKNSLGVFDENSLIVPTGLYFDKTHTWALIEKDGKVRIGIDDFLQHITGPLTKVKMKNSGEIVKKGEPILSIIQNGKLLNINSPVSGKIIEQNDILVADPSIINQSPYSSGWVYMIEPTNWLREIQFFLMADKYREWIQYEFWRLKDFLTIKLNTKMPQYAHVVLQDGGAIKDNVLADFGPEVWEEFQINFIDTMK